MVRLKAVHAKGVKSARLCFNSYMVRLKEIDAVQHAPVFISFNSYMVRLKVFLNQLTLVSFYVSIPTWYD